MLRQTGRDMARFMKDYDLILSPTMTWAPTFAGRGGHGPAAEGIRPLGHPQFGVLLRCTTSPDSPPCRSPLYWSGEGLPVGVMFAARFGAEHTLLSLAGQLEQARPWFDRLPPI